MGMSTGLRRRLQRAAVEDHRGGLGLTSTELVQETAQVFHHDLENPGRIQRCVW
jgi:hypothetical protein